VINWSHNDEHVRLKVQVRVPHDSDLDQVIALMREAAARPRRILSSPPPNVLILSFSEIAMELEVRFWIADARNGVHNVKSEVRLCRVIGRNWCSGISGGARLSRQAARSMH
jgi:small-conductance mechanosensitive channel